MFVVRARAERDEASGDKGEEGGRTTHRWTNNDTDGALALNEGHPLLLLQREHEEREGEGKRLPGTGERDPDHVTTGEAGDSSRVSTNWLEVKESERTLLVYPAAE